MTSIVRVCPLSGGLSPGDNYACTPHCYLLEVDQFTFLLDCGWDASFTGNGGKACLEPFLRYIFPLFMGFDNHYLQQIILESQFSPNCKSRPINLHKQIYVFSWQGIEAPFSQDRRRASVSPRPSVHREPASCCGTAGADLPHLCHRPCLQDGENVSVRLVPGSILTRRI